MTRARIEFIRHTAALVYAADLARAVERSIDNARPPSRPLYDHVSKDAVEAAVALADALDSAGYPEAV